MGRAWRRATTTAACTSAVVSGKHTTAARPSMTDASRAYRASSIGSARTLRGSRTAARSSTRVPTRRFATSPRSRRSPSEAHPRRAGRVNPTREREETQQQDTPQPGAGAVPWSAMPEDRTLQLADYVEDERDRIVATLFAWLRIPSISAQPEHAGDVRASADFIAGRLEEAGLEHVQILETAGAPAVYAEWLRAGAGAPTVLVYGHHDVQPVHPLELWTAPPFDPT